jgi:hypothetical protein
LEFSGKRKTAIGTENFPGERAKRGADKIEIFKCFSSISRV